jgi:hypothetical protein
LSKLELDPESLQIVLNAADNYLLYLKRIKPLKHVRIDGIVFDEITPRELQEYTGEIETAIARLDAAVAAVVETDAHDIVHAWS